MTVEHVLAVVPVTDIDSARQWYERLFGRAPDNNPMDSLVEWQVTGNGWVQVTRNADRAGSAMLNLAVSDLDEQLAAISARGLSPGPKQPVNKGVVLSAIDDPDGNTITFVGSFRVVY